MHCSHCRAENREGARFCRECGTPLAMACQRCGLIIEPGSRFCDGCGSPLGSEVGPETLLARSAVFSETPASYTPKRSPEKVFNSLPVLEGERKQVTVLFVDVAGFTSMSERLDPEDVHTIMQHAFKLMLEEVHHFEGTVSQFLGDGIMALFGAPLAHEDHAQRAVHAALGIRKALEAYQEDLRQQRDLTFQVRQGLNTGLVVVGPIGTDLRTDYTAMGDTTNISARLQQTADRGQILVSEATHRLVKGYFQTRILGGLTLKGKTEPVVAWEILGMREGRTRMEVAAEGGLTPYVGREPELQALLDCFDKARGGQGQVAFIIGEPGIGKSRLLHEFHRKLSGDATWIEGQCMSFGQSMAMHPIIDMMKRTFGIEGDDNESTIADKIALGVLNVGEHLRPIIPYLRHLLSIEPGDPAVLTMDPQQRRGETFDALRQFFVEASTIQPLIRVHEDCHWMDKATEDYLSLMATIVPANRILDIFTYRTSYSHPFGNHTYHSNIRLTPLSVEDSKHMAESVLSVKSLPRDLHRLVTSRAEGNPFFLEEIIKSLQEAGAIRRSGERYVLAKRMTEIFVPSTIQDVIMARIDRLDEVPKKILQLASVIGREFTTRLLDRITDIQDHGASPLQELKAVGLIYEKRLSSEQAYIFKHALTHDIAYGSLLIQRRKELHRIIALAIETLYADRLAEQYEVLAHHFTRAEDWSHALGYLLRSAEKALKSFANREAVVLYDKSLDVTSRLEGSVDVKVLMSIREAKANAYFALSDFLNSHGEGESLLALARQTGDKVKEGAALASMAFSSFWAHDFDKALEESRQALDVATQVDAAPVIAASRFTNGYIYATTERLEAARIEWTEALRIGRATAAHVPESLSLGCLALQRNWAGEYMEAAQQVEEAVHIAHEHRLVMPLLWTVWISGLVCIGKGEYDAALMKLEQHLAFSEKVGAEVISLRVLNTLGWLWIEFDNHTRALDMNNRSADGARKRGDPETFANANINLADLLLAQGKLPEAQEVTEETYKLVKHPATSDWMRWRYSTHLFSTMGDLSLICGNTAKAWEWADQCLEIATRTNSTKNLAKGWRLRGEVALAERRWDDSLHALQQALIFARRTANPTQIWKTHVALGRLNEARRRPDAAYNAYVEARKVLDGINNCLHDERLRSSFDTSPLIQQVYKLSAPR
ncbi:MAG: AAA family ATPase [Nitrospira sp.]|nr:AAA family ATPase [Nitrospira sp.]